MTQTTTEGDLKTIKQYILRPAGSLPWEPALAAFERVAELIDHYVPKVQHD